MLGITCALFLVSCLTDIDSDMGANGFKYGEANSSLVIDAVSNLLKLEILPQLWIFYQNDTVH